MSRIRDPKIKIREYTKEELKAYALNWFEQNYSRVVPTPNIAVRGRKYSVKKGRGDLTGIKLFTGVHIEAEIKTINDKFYSEQVENMNFLVENNALAFVVHQYNESILVTPWQQYKEIYPVKMQSKK